MNILGVRSVVLFAAAFIVSAIGVALFRRWSGRRGLLDVPNERSSHSTPTPRGGGLMIVIVSLLGYLIITQLFGLHGSWGYFLGALMVAGVSWLDDLFSLPFWARLIVHIAAAVVLIYDVGFWSELSVPLTSQTITLGTTIGFVLAVGWIAWFLNAYNFMDGIDGIAALQAIVTCLAWVAIALIFDLPATALLSGIVASASAGFLIHNWQPARIFMGDVGSAFLGFTLAAIPLLARTEARRDIPLLPVIGVSLVWFFLFDTVFTMLRRILGGKRIWEAHREHIYQKLVIEGRKHSNVTLIYGAAAAALSLLVVLALLFSGIFPALAFFFLVFATAGMTYVAVRENIDLNH